MRKISYSAETVAAHSELLLTAMEVAAGKEPESGLARALKHLAAMVHCDISGEIHGAHTLLTNRRTEEWVAMLLAEHQTSGNDVYFPDGDPEAPCGSESS